MTPTIDGAWWLDPVRSSVEFRVPNFWGLMTVKGRFERYEGTLDLAAHPAIELIIDAASLESKNARRDQHLRSGDFFDVENHPQVRFESDSATVAGNTLNVSGQLHAAGKHIPLDVEGTVREVDGELEIEATASADQRDLGMTWNRAGMVRAPSKLIVQGRLLRKDPRAADGPAEHVADPVGTA